MLVSSTSMNVASVTVRAIIHGFTAGRHSAASFMVMDAAPIIFSTPASSESLSHLDIESLNHLKQVVHLSGLSDSDDFNPSMIQCLYLIQTLGTTDIPGRRSCPLVWSFSLSNTIFTGMRCTTLT